MDLTISFENPPTTIYFETKYLAELVPQYDQSAPSNQLIRNIRVGLLECGWFSTGRTSVAARPTGFRLHPAVPRQGK